MILSKNIYHHKIDEINQTLVFHKWYGNPILMENELHNKFIASTNVSDFNNETIKEWLEAGFILNEKCDERDIYNKYIYENTKQVLDGRNLDRLDLIVSENCNMGCQHCIYFAGNERHSTKSFMKYTTALNAFQEFLAVLRKQNKVNFELHFGGAEPLTNWVLIKQIVDTFPKYLKSSESIFWHINTNLLILNDEISSYFEEYKFNIYTSLDGLQHSNDLSRVKLSGTGTFEIVVNNIKLLKSLNCPIKEVICTITKENISLINTDFIDYLKELKVPHIGIDFDLVSSPDFDIKDIINKLTTLFWYCYDLDITCTGTWLTPFFHIINNDVRQKQFSFCGAMSGENLSITPNGELTLCSYMSTKIGTINSIQSMFAMQENHYASLINSRQPGRDKHCMGCMLEGQCAGQCHITRETDSKSKGIIDKMCNFYRDVTLRMLTEYSLRNQ